MNKWLGVLWVLTILGGLWFAARTYWRVTPIWNQPKFASVKRGDVRVPISAAGLIEPRLRIEVKSKASGEIIDIPVYPGSYVRAGDVLVVLEPDVEQRSRDRAQSNLNLAKTNLAAAKLDVDKAHQAVKSAQSRLASLEAEAPALQMDFDRASEDRLHPERGTYSPMDFEQKKAALERNKASRDAARAELEQCQLNVRAAEIVVEQQQENVFKAQKDLDDAEERLADTTIRATQDALVTEVPVQVGEKIQSAINSVTGGTLLMKLADVSTLKVVTRVDEADYGRIIAIAPPEALPQTPFASAPAMAALPEAGTASDVGDPAPPEGPRRGRVRITVEAFRDTEFSGVIERIEPQGRIFAGAAVIQYDVHVELVGENRYKAPLGAQAQVEFTVESVHNALIVPAEAVRTWENQQGVWKSTPPPPGQHAKGRKFVPCRIGISDGEFTELIGPLNSTDAIREGDEVYTKLPPEPKEDE